MKPADEKVVRLSDRTPVTFGAEGVGRERTVSPCPARVLGPFLGTEAGALRCGGTKGHPGRHFFHVEWGEGPMLWTPGSSTDSAEPRLDVARLRAAFEWLIQRTHDAEHVGSRDGCEKCDALKDAATAPARKEQSDG